MSFSTGSILIGALLLGVQLLAAVPWLAIAFLTREERLELRRRPLAPWVLQRVGVCALACLVRPAGFLMLVQDRGVLEVSGRVYAAVLQAQLTVDFFIGGFALLLAVWPKGGAVAFAAFREGVRQ